MCRDEPMTPEDADAWVNFWIEAGRAKMREIEAAIMASDVPEEERLAALARFRAAVGSDHVSEDAADSN